VAVYHILRVLSLAQDRSAPRHRIYLLTIWEERSGASEVAGQWRFSLEHPTTGQRRGFASLTALVAALQELLAELEKKNIQ
jgi:hypothetical protein